MRQILCLAAEPWTNRPTRTQQLMSRMEGAQVLYFTPPARRGSDDWKKPGRQLRPGILVYTLPPTLAPRPMGGPLSHYDTARAVKFVRTRMEKHGFRDPLLWCATPAGWEYLEQVSYRGVVYDCFQDWPRYPESWESELTSAADVAFAASPDLMAHLAPCSANVALLPFGCNYPMFAKDSLPRPGPLRDIHGPILGYMGPLWPDLDLTPLLGLAQTRPDCAIVLVGRDKGCRLLPQLLDFPNVRWVGPVEAVDEPDYLCNFHVCLHLLRRGRLYDDVIPARMFEYLAAGRPIVAMLRPDQVEHFPDVVYGAHDASEFVRLCDEALKETGSYARDRRRAYGQANSWAVRAQEVIRILESIGLLT